MLHFGRFEWHSERRQLLHDGQPMVLGSRAFDLLSALIQRRGQIVTKGELLDLVWPGLVVEESNLHVQVSALRKLLGPGAIATIPGRGYQFTATLEGADGSDAPSHVQSVAVAVPGNVGHEPPQLYGRAYDLEALLALVARDKLVTIVGAGGIGKTSVARAIGHHLQRSFADGVWLADLSSVSDPSLVANAVAGVMRIALTGDSRVEGMCTALHASRSLIVLDNCEHVLSGAAELAQGLLGGTHHVHLLATSQAPLRVPHEQLYRLAPLDLPADASLASCRSAGAVELFEARTRALQPTFELSDANASEIADICRRLDGIALAIELAAARVPLLGIGGLRRSLADRFRVLTGGAPSEHHRHQTLRGALEWSYGLLAPDEQALFRRLGVFVGSFGLGSAQRLGADADIDEWRVLDLLAALIDKSLVALEPGEETRYRLLESAREFARQQLIDLHELESVQDRHVEAFRSVFEAANDAQWDLPLRRRLDRYLPDIDNLRAALARAQAAGDSETFAALAGAAKWIWSPADRRVEGLAYCRRAIALLHDGVPPGIEARLQLGYAQLAYPQVSAREMGAVDRAIDLYRSLGDSIGLFRALVLAAQRHDVRAQAPLGRANYERARQLLAEAAELMDPQWPLALRLLHLQARAWVAESPHAEESSATLWEEYGDLCESIGEQRDAMRSRMNAAVQCFGHDLDTAIRILRRTIAADLGDPVLGAMGAFAKANLSEALLRSGQYAEALQWITEAAPALNAGGLFATFLDATALIVLRLGHAKRAAIALGRADRAFADLGARRQPDSWARDTALNELRETLAPPDLERWMRQGAGLSDAAVTSLVLGI